MLYDLGDILQCPGHYISTKQGKDHLEPIYCLVEEIGYEENIPQSYHVRILNTNKTARIPKAVVECEYLYRKVS